MRKLLKPRIYSILFTYKNGAIKSEMLGVTFSYAQRQKFYDQYRRCRYFLDFTGNGLKDVVFKSEEL